MRSRPWPPSKRTLREKLRLALWSLSQQVRTLASTSGRETAGTVAFVAVAATICFTGYLQGAMTIAVVTPAILGIGTVVVLQAGIACLTVTGLFGLSVLTLFGQVRMACTDQLPTTAPTVAAVVSVSLSDVCQDGRPLPVSR